MSKSRFARWILLAVTFWPISANADWQFTKWGMTEREVVKASGNRAAPVKPDPSELPDLQTKLEMPYKAGVFAFDASFAFDEHGKLADVFLKLTAGNPAVLRESLEEKYGEPTPVPGDSDGVSWKTSRDVIFFTSIGGDLTELSYKPRANSNNRGL